MSAEIEPSPDRATDAAASPHEQEIKRVLDETARGFAALDARLNELFGYLQHLSAIITQEHAGIERISDQLLQEVRQSAGIQSLANGPGEPSEARTTTRSRISDRGLFIVGHARSGTTILLEALNGSDDVFCLAEANFHQNLERNNFADWYNTMHRSFSNPHTRSFYVFDFPGSGWRVLHHLADEFRYVGDKLAFRDPALGYDYFGWYAFATRHFPRSHYICLLRDPIEVSRSCIEMFSAGQFTDENLEGVAKSQLLTYYLMLDLLFTLPNVYFLRHEDIGPHTFEQLGVELDVIFPDSASHYIFDHKTAAPEIAAAAQRLPVFSSLIQFYERIRDCIYSDGLRPRPIASMRRIHYDLYELLNGRGLIAREWTKRN